MLNQHPITPPPELLLKWHIFAPREHDDEGYVLVPPGHLDHIATQAAQWGADQELEACCEWLCNVERWKTVAEGLRTSRRPKPPSLKEQALEELEQLRGDANSMGMGFDAPAVRAALEALDD